MKHDNIPKNFHSPYMKKVANKLSILKMTPAERNSYYAYMKQIYTDRDSLETALEKGREKGKAEETKKYEEEYGLQNACQGDEDRRYNRIYRIS